MTNTNTNDKKFYIANAFSLQMIPINFNTTEVEITERGLWEMQELAENGCLVSAIGHTDTAAVVSSELGVDLPANRVNVSLKGGDTLYVAQLMGGRLPEGATTLPEGFKIRYIRVRIKPDTSFGL